MYVVAIPNRTSPPAILLRESYRDGRRVKNRTLANLSAWPPERIEALRRLLRGAAVGPLASDGRRPRPLRRHLDVLRGPEVPLGEVRPFPRRQAGQTANRLRAPDQRGGTARSPSRSLPATSEIPRPYRRRSRRSASGLGSRAWCWSAIGA